jgi:hypothetical protein
MHPLRGSTCPAALPECECDDAREDLLDTKREYRGTHRKVSTTGPRMMMIAGFSAAGLVLDATMLLSVGPVVPSERPEARSNQRDAVMVAGGTLMMIPLALGFAGPGWYGRRVKDGAPYRERDRELFLRLKSARERVGDLCANEPRR